LSLSNTCTVNFLTTGFIINGVDGNGVPLSGYVPPAPAVLNMATISIPDAAIPKACRPISNNLILDTVFYNSGDPELKDSFG
jgi:hypothetical protein